MLIGVQQTSFVRQKIGAGTRHRLNDKKDTDGISRLNIRQKNLQKWHTAQRSHKEKDANAPIDQLIDVDKGIDLLFVISGKYAVQMKYDHLLKTQLRKGQCVQDGCKGAVQAQHLHTQILDKYLAADEAQQDGDDLSYQANHAVAHGLLGAIHGHSFFSPKNSSSVFHPACFLMIFLLLSLYFAGINLHKCLWIHSCLRILDSFLFSC